MYGEMPCSKVLPARASKLKKLPARVEGVMRQGKIKGGGGEHMKDTREGVRKDTREGVRERHERKQVSEMLSRYSIIVVILTLHLEGGK